MAVACDTGLSMAKADTSTPLRAGLDVSAMLSPRLRYTATEPGMGGGAPPMLDLPSLGGGGGGCKRSFSEVEGTSQAPGPLAKQLRFDSGISQLAPLCLDKDLRREAEGCSAVEAAVKGRRSLEATAATATQIFDECATAFLFKYHSRNEWFARKEAEANVKTKYDELVSCTTSLLEWVDGTSSACELPEKYHKIAGQGYEVVEFKGRALPTHQSRRCEELWEQLRYARKNSDSGYARDALCAAMAAISSREEQNWLDAWEMEDTWKEREDAEPRWRRRAVFEEFVKEVIGQGARGYFSNALVDKDASFRVALSRKDGMRIPASLLITMSLPMCKALGHMDGDGPLRGKPAAWRRYPAYALQELLPQEPKKGLEGARHERVKAKALQAERGIRNMIRSSADVILLDALAALAPRAESRDQGLTMIVKTELESLLREAKERGQGVVFMLGGDQCERLARKVYMKPPFTNYGLRLGYLRWRKSVTGPWAREKPDDDRILIGLQLP